MNPLRSKPIVACSGRGAGWLLSLALGCASGLGGCRAEAPTPALTPSASASPTPRADPGAPHDLTFTDITAASGVDFRHHGALDETYWMTQISSSGVALFDYDGDGLLDIYFTEAGDQYRAEGGVRTVNRLYAQQANGMFVDRTEQSGLGDDGYGMGVAVGDIDNDGDPDVYLTNAGFKRLYLNDGKGHFTDITATAGVAGDDCWSSSAGFFDYDLDGLLDLYVANYSRALKQPCVGPGGNRVYCGPRAFEPLPHTLYRNLGGGKFEDVSAATGIDKHRATGLGLLFLDLTGDRLIDIYVANDRYENFVWVNDGAGHFTEQATQMGLAVDEYGIAEASMGLTVSDVDDDGDFDLFTTNAVNETNTLYLDEGSLGWRDGTATAGLGVPSTLHTGFGTVFFDVEHDGDEDLAVANGRIQGLDAHDGHPAVGFAERFGEVNQLYERVGRGLFVDSSARSGDLGTPVAVSRGLAVGDLDNDGDFDLVVANTEGVPQVLRNDAPKLGHYLMVQAIDPRLARELPGTVLKVRAGGKTFTRLVGRTNSYLTSSDPRVHVGLGAADHCDEIVVLWADGTDEHFPGGPADREVRLLKGTARVETVAVVRPAAVVVAPTVPVTAALPSSTPGVVAPGEIPEAAFPGAEARVLAALGEGRARVVAEPDRATAWFEYGRLLEAHRLRDRARPCYDRALELDPSLVSCRYLRARLIERESPPDAVAEFQLVVRAEPTNLPALLRLADLLRALARGSEATDLYRRALVIDPRSAGAHLGLGQLAMANNQLREALPHLQAAVAAAPGDSAPHLELSRLFQRVGETARAEKEAALARDAHDHSTTEPIDLALDELNVSSDGSLRRAARLHRAGRAKEALAEYDAALAARPPEAPVLNNRGLTREKLGDIDGALADYSRAIEVDPNYAAAYINRAVVKNGRREFASGIADLDRAIAIDPKDASVWMNRAFAHREAGNRTQAVADLDEAIRLNPGLARAYWERGQLRIALGDAAGGEADKARGLALRGKP